MSSSITVMFFIEGSSPEFKARRASRCAACRLPVRQHLPFRTRVHHVIYRYPFSSSFLYFRGVSHSSPYITLSSSLIRIFSTVLSALRSKSSTVLYPRILYQTLFLNIDQNKRGPSLIYSAVFFIRLFKGGTSCVILLVKHKNESRNLPYQRSDPALTTIPAKARTCFYDNDNGPRMQSGFSGNI